MAGVLPPTQPAPAPAPVVALPPYQAAAAPRTRGTREAAWTVRAAQLRADTHRVLAFLRRWFYIEEPLNAAVGLEEQCEALDEYVEETLAQGLSLLAEDEDHNVVAVLLLAIAHPRPHPHPHESVATQVEAEAEAAAARKVAACPDIKFRRVLQVLQQLELRARVWERVCVPQPQRVHGQPARVLEVRIVATHGAWRGRGLMRALCAAAEDVAREHACCALRMDATSAFSAAAAERLNYTRVYSARYADIPPPPLCTAPLVPQPPHTHAAVYLKLLH